MHGALQMLSQGAEEIYVAFLLGCTMFRLQVVSEMPIDIVVCIASVSCSADWHAAGLSES